MPRVKRGTLRTKKRRKLMSLTKGYTGTTRKISRLAKTAIKKAGVHAYRGRKFKKRANRGLWQIRLNAAAREYGLSYSKFMGLLKKSKIELDRKVLSQIAAQEPSVFKKIIDQIKK